eukprot:12590221-Alexandrium_andersonii.AAC.1
MNPEAGPSPGSHPPARRPAASSYEAVSGPLASMSTARSICLWSCNKGPPRDRSDLSACSALQVL